MDPKILEAIITQLAQLDAAVTKMVERMDKQLSDWEEFSERFDEVVTRLENERRLDFYAD
jgi:hypothetical protein